MRGWTVSNVGQVVAAPGGMKFKKMHVGVGGGLPVSV